MNKDQIARLIRRAETAHQEDTLAVVCELLRAMQAATPDVDPHVTWAAARAAGFWVGVQGWFCRMRKAIAG